MLFNSPTFVFLFLPLVLSFYFVAPDRAKNSILLAASLLFYAWGDSHSVLLLIVSTLANYACGLLLGRIARAPMRKSVLAAVITANLLVLLYYKYLIFFVTNLTSLNLIAPDRFDFSSRHLPLGISFYTFGIISYLIDIYRKNHPPEKNVINLGLFVALFPKLVAGPIVRYGEIALALGSREVTLEGFAYGASRFVIGLGKKVLIATPMATFADEAFGIRGAMDAPTAWLGVLCYTLQIYYDFSGYSDMAIGLGRMFGLEMAENFRYPYISQSIQEFWRRWHISLSMWFRDYVYIPLGGSRKSGGRTYLNLAIVFLLCGFWHGASWNFVIWGLYQGVFLILERLKPLQFLQPSPNANHPKDGREGVLISSPEGNGLPWGPPRTRSSSTFLPGIVSRSLRHLYAILVIMIGWVFFRADSLPHALQYIRAMFSFTYDGFAYYSMTFWSRQLLFCLVIAIVGSTPLPELFRGFRHRIEKRGEERLLRLYDFNCSLGSLALMILIFAASAMQLAVSTFSPFIYNKF